MHALEEIIGYEFRDSKLLTHALTHSSYANENRLGHEGSNERLEFLGDAVLELISSELFFFGYKHVPEGELTKMRASFVCEPALAYCAEKIHLGQHLFLGKGEDTTGGRSRPSITSDALEALIGAIYLDGGYEAAKTFVMNHVLNDLENKRLFYDSKTTLQEVAQRKGYTNIEYTVLDETGPDHNKVYTVAIMLDGKKYGQGEGSSKKNAEQKAAYEALSRINSSKP